MGSDGGLWEMVMVDLDTGRTAVARETGDLLGRLHPATDADWERPTRCAGWTVRDLVVHVAWACAAQAIALEHLREGSLEQPSGVRADLAGASATELVAAVAEGRERLLAALGALQPGDLERMCPLPFGLVPGVIALQIVVFEYGIHANDLAWALGEEVPLAPDMIAAAAGALGAALPLLAQLSSSRPADGVAYRLRGHTVSLGYVAEGGTWRALENGHALTASVSGDDSAVMLFAMGRIPADHASLRVEGDPAVAVRFKEFFPGP